MLFLFGEVPLPLWMLWTCYVILLWHSLSLSYNYFGLLSGHLLEKCCSLGWPYVIFVFRLLVTSVISRFGFFFFFGGGGGDLGSDCSLSDHCILVTFS